MHTISDLMQSIKPVNAVDIFIIACLIYFVLAWVKGTRAQKILGTMFGMGVVYFAASRMGLVLTSVLFQYFWAAIILVLVIVFQPEIREMMDRASPVRYLRRSGPAEVADEALDEIVRAVADLAGIRTGALIVFKRADRLDTLISKGKPLDCVISAEALQMVFHRESPLHDGAVLISEGRIETAGCILPLSRSEQLDSYYGTRHRAALGLTERCDALSVVVSEERGDVSFVQSGSICHVKTRTELRQTLSQALAQRPVGKANSRPGLWSYVYNDWPLKAAAVVLAVALWFVVVGLQRSELGMSVPIQYTRLPADAEITGKWMDRVDVRLRGSEASLAGLSPGSVRAVVDLNGVVDGLNYFRVTDKNLLVPPGVSVSEIRPSDLVLNIEASSLKKVAVVPSLTGSLPEKTKVSVTPAEVQVRALQDELKKVTSVTTDPVSVSDLTQKGKIVVPVVVKPDGLKIDSLDPIQVTVIVETDKS